MNKRLSIILSILAFILFLFLAYAFFMVSRPPLCGTPFTIRNAETGQCELYVGCSLPKGVTEDLTCKEILGFGQKQNNSWSYTALADYFASIYYSCSSDSDCIVQDVHSCCGFYSACTNKISIVDADFVKTACEKEMLVSTCESPQITGCTCVNNKCIHY